jgi:hypothetical protein
MVRWTHRVFPARNTIPGRLLLIAFCEMHESYRVSNTVAGERPLYIFMC